MGAAAGSFIKVIYWKEKDTGTKGRVTGVRNSGQLIRRKVGIREILS